jgi:histidine triad (HIT) family protein
MEDCIFCRIVQKKIPTEIIYENKELLVFPDIKPKAPVHLLIIPKKHIVSIQAVKPAEEKLLAKMILTARKVAAKKGLAAAGYRLIINQGLDAGQAVPHLHLHLLGGRKLS